MPNRWRACGGAGRGRGLCWNVSQVTFVRQGFAAKAADRTPCPHARANVGAEKVSALEIHT
jgi:hypothetical protein